MFNALPFTIVGNLTGDPELRFTPSGVAVARFTVAHTPRTKPAGSAEWTDGEPTYLDCTAWRTLAENVTETLSKGARVIATGRLRTERWEDKDDTGKKRSRMVLDVDAVGPDLSYATASVKKMRRNDGAPDDPWSTASRTRPEPAAAPAGPGSGFDDEPAF
jgi:single-strand DNA-binding protein